MIHTLRRWMALGLLTGLPAIVLGMNTNGDTLIIVCFGNSTTAVRKGLSKPYPERLAERFRERDIPAKIFNAGKGGNHTGRTSDNAFHKGPHAMERFGTDVLDRRPGYMVLCFGINDAWQDEGRHGRSRIPAREYRQNLRVFQEKVAIQGGRTIFLGPNPLGERYAAYRNHRMGRYMRISRRVARSTHSDWLNTRKLFRRTAGEGGIDRLLMDGMHPNDAGHEIIANAILDKIQLK